MSDLHPAFYIVSFLLVLGYVVRRHMRRTAPDATGGLPFRSPPQEQAPSVTSPALADAVAKPSGNGAMGTPRERRLGAIQERARTGLCLYCDDAAKSQRPRRVKVEPFFGWLFRMVNAIPHDRWRVEVQFSSEEPDLLCAAHHAQWMLHLQGEIVRVEQERIAFERAQVIAMDEFERFGLDELMFGEKIRVLRAPTRPPLPVAPSSPT